jgi:eukaryotic-like serine/threonine-protein kinase
MSISAGTRLGPYEIVSTIGAGGMGEVFRARDTRLDRDVALKVLASAARVDSDRLRRFEQEARATAALNHPNILAVFDVGADGGVSYLVSELLDGETLRERLRGGPLAVRKAIEYAAQLARGLAAAHDKGIVHRDLKPENVFVTRDGRIKILDFGIAKLTAASDPAGQPAGQTAALTVERGTTPGMVFGTVGYMSPEQIRGFSTDHRTDIFSFGAILYEMLSGRRAFAGATHPDTMSAILSSDPRDLSEQRHEVPPILERLVRHCLEKTPDERFQSARDVAFALESLSSDAHSTGARALVEASRPRPRFRRASIAAAVALGAMMGSAAVWTLATRAGAADPAPRFQQLTFRRGTITAARFSPDAETLVYSAGWDGHSQELYSARLGSSGERTLGIQGELLSISKAGEIALLRDVRAPTSNWLKVGTLARAPLAGGAPRDILRDIGSADWSPDGQQLAITRLLAAERRWRLEFPIGTVLYESSRWIDQPRVSPDGTRILLIEHPISGDSRGRLILVTLDGKKVDVTPEYTSLVGAAWAPAGDEAWFTASTSGMRHDLLAVRPGGKVRAIGPVPASLIVEDIAANGRVLLQTLSMRARMLVKTPADADERDISWLDYPLLRDISADGSTILFDEQGDGAGPIYGVFVRHTDGAPAVRIGDGFAQQLSPDLQWALTVPVGSPTKIVIVPLGPGDAKTITVPLETVRARRWFPDGKRLAINGSEPGRPPRAYEYSIEGGGLRALTPADSLATSISPDGRMLTVTTGDGKQMLWPLGGGEPREIQGLAKEDVVLRWAIDGQSLFVSSARSTRTRDIARLDLASGRRQALATVGPSDAAGVRTVAAPLVSADGRTYVYRYNQLLSDLFVSDGLR